MRSPQIARIVGFGCFLGATALALSQEPEGAQCGAGRSPAQRCGSAKTQAEVLATVDGKTVTLADLDARVRDEIAGRDDEIARGRRDALEEAIAERLLEIEARKRRETADQLYFIEVVERVAVPTQEQIRTEYEAQRDPKDASTLEDVREWIVGKLQGKQEAELFAQWTAAARGKVPILYRADVNAPGLRPAAVLAVVGGQSITAGAIQVRLRVKRDEVEWRVYERERTAVAKLVKARLADAEAFRQNVSPDELLRAEITNKTRPVSDADVATYFEQHRSEFDASLASSRAMIAEFLNADALEEAEHQFYSRLSEAAEVRMSVPEPAPIALPVPTKGSPVRGKSTAPVTIVEFADFECPPCGRLYPQLDEALEVYGDRVRLVFRQFPLRMHPHAFRAARASEAAASQGKFWCFADRLFRNQKSLDDASLKLHALQCGLDAERFARGLDSESSGVRVIHDVREGRVYGVKWTPTLFVNGIQLRGDLRPAIDDALAKSSHAKPPPR
jgi:protein-disulfide isomerase